MTKLVENIVPVEDVEVMVDHRCADMRPRLSLAYMSASVLLGRMEEVAKSLEPERPERARGGMPSSDKDFLERIASGSREAGSTAGAILHHKE